ncbi:hypothetical protein [Streptomyces sp. NPDC046939]|uniref:hypothetical protein n=1 Tax=Streptomyces sp. NPDC046939 TaxID=3155376 RepID=UPI0033CE9D6D
MNDDAEQQHSGPAPMPAPVVSTGYARHQLAKAFVTALTHEDDAARDRAERRVRDWRAVLAGMAAGTLTIGSRTPVRGLPAWITPKVVRGGFVTGEASASGPLLPYETEAARAAGVPADRGALFAYSLTEPGLARLGALLDSGRYEVTVPEEAVLLTVAWLVRAGEVEAAVELVGAVRPFADRLRFLPRPSATPAPDARAVHRRTVGDAAHTLSRRRPNDAVETQREALTVWQPFGDELLALWLETADDSGQVLRSAPDAAWRRRAAELLDRYHRLAVEHARCTKHRRPKENLAVLRGALEETVAGRALDARRLGLLRHVVASMVRRRGAPGSERLRALRDRQAAQAALPSHHAFAQLLLRRIAPLPQDAGAADVAPLTAPVTDEESRATGLLAGAPVPDALCRTVETSLSASVDVLVERGVVPSAEVLAELVPQLVAATTAEAYADDALRTLVAVNYRAFRARRSLLLLNLAHQIRVEELPWVKALAPHQNAEAVEDTAREVLRQVGELAVGAFPGTLLPNPLVRELSVLARQAELGAPFVEELAADIFMGTFTPKFLQAARVAAELLTGTLYERYYGIDYAAVRNLAIAETGTDLTRTRRSRTSPGFAELCRARAGAGDTRSVAVNGTVIEQAQILTTHNLATLVHRVGIAPGPGWDELARHAYRTVCRLVARVRGNPRPLATVKDAAYAWRQMIFYVSLCPARTQRAFLDWTDEETARHPGHVAARLAPARAGLRLATADPDFRFAPDGTDGTGSASPARRFQGWTTKRHWITERP